MRGIPPSLLIIFIVVLVLVELLSWFGFRLVISTMSKRTKIYLNIIYLVFSFFVSGLVIITFANPEILRQSRDYTFFLVLISLGFIDLIPKSFFSLITFLSFIFRGFLGKRFQLVVLSGSLLICTGLFFIILFGIFVGRYDIQVEKQDIYISELPQELEGFRIIQLSDIHLGSYLGNTKVLEETVQLVDQIQPDLILFTGDIVNNFGDEMRGFEPYLSALSAKYGKYAIQGNHDYGDYYNWPDSISKEQNLMLIESGLTKAGFKLLLNQSDQIAVKDTSIILIGVENWGHKPFPQYANLDRAMLGIPAKSFKILMSHDPAYWKAKIVNRTDIPLTLSGHTHGGQIGINLDGITFSPIYFIQKEWGGLYQSENQFLYVNRGLGTVGFPGRIDMRPEISLLTLHRTKIH